MISPLKLEIKNHMINCSLQGGLGNQIPNFSDIENTNVRYKNLIK